MLLHLLLRGRQNPDYRKRWFERLAFYSGRRLQSEQRTLVFHAVSVGEVHASIPLIKAVAERYPEDRLLVSCTTPTGSERVRALLGDKVEHVYLPYDLPGAIRRFLSRYQPAMVVMMETELWPNLMYHCARRNIHLVLANARLSEKSCRGYMRLAALVRPMLAHLDVVAAQSDADAERFVRLGLEASRVQVTGTVKYDLDIRNEQVEAGRELRNRLFGKRPVWIAASTREGEDALIFQACQQILSALPDAGLILVPRHLERFDSAAELFAKAGLRVARRSIMEGDSDTQVLIGDSMGEMQLYYGAADLAFVGGSLVNTGCQNILEPAALGMPVLIGPSRFNFQSVSDELKAAGALQIVPDPAGLAEAVVALFEEAGRRREMGQAAQRVFAEKGGASRKVFDLLAQLLGSTA